MNKLGMKVENIPKELVKKHHKNKSKTPLIKPQFQWLKDYLNDFQIQPTNQNININKQKFHIPKKMPLKFPIKNKHKLVYINNENYNIDNLIIYQKIGNISKTLIHRNITQSQPYQSITMKDDPFPKKYSCQLIRQTKKQGANLHNRSYLLRINKHKHIEEIESPIDPWEIQDKNQADITNYKFI